MGKLTELDDIRRQRQKRRTARQILLLLVIIPVAAILYVLKDSILNSEFATNMQSLFKNANSVIGYPVDLPENEIIKITGFNQDLLVQSRTNLYIYDKRGMQINSIQLNYKSPIIKTAKKRFLVYDQGQNSLSVYSRTKQLKKITYNYPITVADMAQNGTYAVSTGEQQYVSQVIVYNSSNSEQFKWSSADKIVNALALSDNGKYIAITCIDVAGGVLESNILIFDTGKTEPVASFSIENSIVLSIEYKLNNNISVITDNKALLYSNSGEKLAEYDYQAQGISFFDNSQPCNTMLVTGIFSQEHKLDIVNLDESYKPKAVKTVAKPVNSAVCEGNFIFIMSDNELICYTAALDELYSELLVDSYLICPIGETVYYNTSEQIKLAKIANNTQTNHP